MRNSIIILLFGLFISLTSCRTDFDTVPSTGGLEFSKDTVYLDTVFANIGSSTYQLKVYNRSNDDIRIPKISLKNGATSKYRITVDGMTGNNNRSFENVELLAKDSLFIFIETTAEITDANPTDFLYTDEINFLHGNGDVQKVDLVTLIQDAIFIKPNRSLPDNIKEELILSGNQTSLVGHELTTESELNWTSTKPYVVYGYALVPNDKTLNVGAGTKVYFHADSGIIVDKQATLNVNGELSTYDAEGNLLVDREVRFEGDRLEPFFEDIPGQWGFVLIMSEATSNIKHLTLKNASIGLYVIPLDIDNFYEAKINISDSQIYNCSNFGLYSIGAKVDANNLVINYCGQACFAGTYGGNYNFTHCTFNNNWNSTKQVTVYINNFNEDAITKGNPLYNANFTNSIIYGSNQKQYLLEAINDNTINFNFNFNHCLIKYNANPIPDFLSNQNIFGNLRNINPIFKNINKNQLQPQTINSGAFQKGIGTSIPRDILGNSRSITQPDIGAYNVSIE